MNPRGRRRGPSLFIALALLSASQVLAWQAATAPPQDPIARVVFAGRPVPGAEVTAARGEARIVTASDADGFVRIPGLEAGAWNVLVVMTGFETLALQIMVPPTERDATWVLQLRPIEPAPRPAAASSASTPRARPIVVAAEPPEDSAAAEGFLVNGSVNNAAASPFAQPRGFGNNRPQPAALYSGHAGFAGGGSRLDARPYSFSGRQSAVPDYTDLQVQAAIGGPLKPWFRGRNAPRFFAAYQGSTRQTLTTESLLVPAVLERAGDFSRTREFLSIGSLRRPGRCSGRIPLAWKTHRVDPTSKPH